MLSRLLHLCNRLGHTAGGRLQQERVVIGIGLGLGSLFHCCPELVLVCRMRACSHYVIAATINTQTEYWSAEAQALARLSIRIGGKINGEELSFSCFLFRGGKWLVYTTIRPAALA